MIYGIGSDIVDIKRIEKVYNANPDLFINKILSQKEQEELKTLSKINQIKKIAKLFSVKEAFSKALHTGIRGDICFKQIELSHDELGAPLIILHGRTKEFVEYKVKNPKIHVSISDEKETVITFVIIESL